jgi:hypothetical protein
MPDRLLSETWQNDGSSVGERDFSTSTTACYIRSNALALPQVDLGLTGTRHAEEEEYG